MTATTIRAVPNQPKTPMRSFRCDDALWDQVKDYATANETTNTAVVVVALKKFFESEGR